MQQVSSVQSFLNAQQVQQGQQAYATAAAAVNAAAAERVAAEAFPSMERGHDGLIMLEDSAAGLHSPSMVPVVPSLGGAPSSPPSLLRPAGKTTLLDSSVQQSGMRPSGTASAFPPP